MAELNQLSVPITFEKPLGANVNLTAWLFTRDGRLIDQAPVTNNTAEFKGLKGVNQSDLRIFVAPEVSDQRITVRTFKDLERFKPYEPVIRFEKDKLIIQPIPSKLSELWQIRFCRVIGKVKKDFTIDGHSLEKPLCKARVHICEVDKIWFWIDRIPDHVILRIPDIILKPIPKPKPFPFPFPPDPGPLFKNVVNPTNFNPIHFNPLLKAQPTLNIRTVTPLPKLPAIDPRIKEQLQSNNVLTIKASLSKNLELFHPYFCAWPWIWPWLYRCDEIKTVYTDNNGRFDTNIIYWAGGDKPDVYFWVEYLIDGVWTTVYRPAIPCYTYWDYACGTEITINVTDPRVRAGCNETIPGEQVWVRSIGNISIRNIKQNDTDLAAVQGIPWHRIGLAKPGWLSDYLAPFATGLNFIVKFGSGLPNNGAKYFRWRAIKVANADLSPFSGASTHYLDDPLTKPYYIEYTDIFGDEQTLTRNHQLGPVSGTPGLFYIPPSSPFNWQGETDASATWQYADTVAASFDSNGFDGDGLYEFALELFDQNGNEIFHDPTIYKVPRLNDSGQTENAPAEFLMQHGGIWDFKMYVRIDNSPTVCDIHDAQVNGNLSGPCGFIKYTDLAAQQVRLSFQAYHPNMFATFSFGVIKGNNTENCPGDTSGFVFSSTPGYTRSGNGEFVSTPNLRPSNMLGTCTKGAFSENLSVYGLHTNGYDRLQVFDSGDVNAFALEP